MLLFNLLSSWMSLSMSLSQHLLIERNVSDLWATKSPLFLAQAEEINYIKVLVEENRITKTGLFNASTARWGLYAKLQWTSDTQKETFVWDIRNNAPSHLKSNEVEIN